MNPSSHAIDGAMSVDVEDYFQVGVFQQRLGRDEWPRFESRVARNVDRLLDFFASHDIHATFFVLGWVAEHHPEVVRRIHAEGHEIGSHGYAHQPLWKLDERTFADDTKRARDAIGSITGSAPEVYRAPCFSITPHTLWALDVLHEQGIRRDSSIFPVRHPEYGLPTACERIHKIILAGGGEMIEFPMTTVRFMGRRWAVGGGGYFRLLPYAVTRRALRSARRDGRPIVFYMHPWEIDPDQPRLDDRTGRLGRFRHYVNLKKTEPRLHRLVRDFSFGTMGRILDESEAGGNLPTVTYGSDDSTVA